MEKKSVLKTGFDTETMVGPRGSKTRHVGPGKEHRPTWMEVERRWTCVETRQRHAPCVDGLEQRADEGKDTVRKEREAKAAESETRSVGCDALLIKRQAVPLERPQRNGKPSARRNPRTKCKRSCPKVYGFIPRRSRYSYSYTGMRTESLK